MPRHTGQQMQQLILCFRRAAISGVRMSLPGTAKISLKWSDEVMSWHLWRSSAPCRPLTWTRSWSWSLPGHALPRGSPGWCGRRWWKSWDKNEKSGEEGSAAKVNAEMKLTQERWWIFGNGNTRWGGETSRENESYTKCTQGGKELNTKNGLDHHMKTHTSHFYCDLCSKIFKNLSLHNRHTKNHISERYCLCDTCSKIFIKRGNLSKRMEIHAGFQ